MFVTEELRSSVGRYLTRMEACATWLADAAPGVAEVAGQAQAAGHAALGAAELAGQTPADRQALTWQLAAERAVHVGVECSTDIGNLIIDALVMRDAGGYADIMRVLMEEQVVPKDWFEAYLGVIQYRDKLLRNYLQVTPEETREAASAAAQLFPQFARSIRHYLNIA